jgi:hypothetical protein
MVKFELPDLLNGMFGVTIPIKQATRFSIALFVGDSKQIFASLL